MHIHGVFPQRTDEARSNAMHCTTLQHTAKHCNAMHCTTLQHTAKHCNTLQHTARHCNTLQHAATHSKEQMKHAALQSTAP